MDQSHLSSSCGQCLKLIRTNHGFKTCHNCELNFHDSCIDVDIKSNIWWCDQCFTRACLNELPSGDTYIDHNCFVGKGLRFAHLNIRSLHYKLDHVNLFLHHNDIDVFCITETWLNDDFDDNDMHIDGYNVFRLDRIKDMEHGGILCYIKNGTSCKQISDLDDDIVEAMWLELNLPQTKPILLGTVYRPPDSKAEYLSRIDSLFQECTNLYDDVVILGDFNVDVNKTCNSKKINNIARHSNLKQLITDFTRVTDKSRTIIDLAFVSNPDRVSSSGVNSLGLSDHSLIYLVHKNKKVKVPPKVIEYRSLKNFNEYDFTDSLKKIDWDLVYNCSDVNDALGVWQDLFKNVCDVHAPIKDKLVKGSKLPEWINNDFIKLSKQRDYFYKKAHKTNDPSDWKSAKSLRNKVNNMNKFLKKTYCDKAINDNVNNSKQLWNTIKKLIPKSKSSVQSVKSKNGLTTNDKEIANQFNEFFTSIGKNLADKFNNNHENNVTCNKNISSHFEFDFVTPEFVFDEICKMSNNKSTGLDNLNIRLLKLAAPIVCDSLSYICYLSLCTSTFPSAWKQAKVTPIFKDGDKSDVNNYRPISVLPVISKIIERSVHNQLYNY